MDPNHIPTATITATEDQNSKTTTDEPDQANDMGTGRSYECVYCKRGFTTAQALGGHMNIHRKDRVKTKPNNASTSNHPSKPEPFGHGHHSTTLISTSHHQSFQTYFPTSSTWCLSSTTTSTTPPYHHQLAYLHNNLNNNNNTPQALNMFNDNWTNIAIASRSPTPSLIDRQDIRSSDGIDNDDDDDEEELDLELRLGHDR